MPFNFGAFELGVLIIIFLIIFGVGRLPEVGGAIGRGIRDLRKAIQDEPEDQARPERRQEG